MTGPGVFHCLPYACDLAEPSCAKRHLTAKGGDTGTRIRLARCIKCEVGIVNAVLHPKLRKVEKGRRWNPQIKGMRGFTKWVQE